MCPRCHSSGGVSRVFMRRRRCVFDCPRCFACTRTYVRGARIFSVILSTRGSLWISSLGPAFSAASCCHHLQSRSEPPPLCSWITCAIAAGYSTSSISTECQDRDLSMVFVRVASRSQVRYAARSKISGSCPLLRLLLLSSPSLLRYPSIHPTALYDPRDLAIFWIHQRHPRSAMLRRWVGWQETAATTASRDLRGSFA